MDINEEIVIEDSIKTLKDIFTFLEHHYGTKTCSMSGWGGKNQDKRKSIINTISQLESLIPPPQEPKS